MPFTYYDPNTVVNPRRFIKNVSVLYDGGAEGFSLAMIDWEGTPHVGIRWNVAFKEQADADKLSGEVMCDGSPSANGIPSWFILPRELFSPGLFNKESGGFMKLVEEWQHKQA